MRALPLLAASMLVTLSTTSVWSAPKTQQPPLPEMIFVDSTGKTVGRYFGNLQFNQLIASTINGMPALLMMTPAQNRYGQIKSQLVFNFSGSGSGPLFFESSDCSGTPYAWTMLYQYGGFPPATVATGADGHLYYYQLSENGAMFVPASNFQNGVCTTQTGSSSYYLPASAPPVDLTTSFTPPFTLR